MSTDILKDIQAELPKGTVTSANFEAANIVVYTDDMDFFRDNNGKIKELVNKFKKRIELRADEKLLKSEEETKKRISENNGMKRPEIAAKVSESLKGKTHSEDTKQKLRDAWAKRRESNLED